MAEHRPKPAPHVDDLEENRGGKMRALLQTVTGKFGGLTSRLPHWSNRTRIAVAVLALLAVGHIVVFVYWVPSFIKTETKRHTTLPAALAALDHNLIIEAKRLATILHEVSPSQTDRGGPLFVLGA